MAHINVNIAGKTYRMACGEGEEAHLSALAEGFDARVAEMRKAFGEIGDMRLHVMAALTISDELLELRRKFEAQADEVAALRAKTDSSEADRAVDQVRIAEGVAQAAERIERLTKSLAAPRASAELSAARPIVAPESDALRPLAARRGGRYMCRAGLQGSSGELSPGPYRLPRELFLASSVDLANTAPTYSVGFPGSTLQRLTWLRTLPNDTSPIRSLKARLRKDVLSRRDALGTEARAIGSRRIAETAFAIPALADAALVGAFWPIRSEVDPLPLARMLFARGQRIALPKVTENGLVFREWREGDVLVKGGFGLSEPHDDLPPLDPTALIVPLAAFDRRGQRIGYGAGYYDQAIERLSRNGPVLTIGVAFSVQEIDGVPAEPHDRPLDHLVTEAGPVPLAKA